MKQKTIQDATETELKATLWELEQRVKPIQEQHRLIINELSKRQSEKTKLKEKNGNKK
jgi:hypothetical protein